MFRRNRHVHPAKTAICNSPNPISFGPISPYIQFCFSLLTSLTGVQGRSAGPTFSSRGKKRSCR